MRGKSKRRLIDRIKQMDEIKTKLETPMTVKRIKLLGYGGFHDEHLEKRLTDDEK